jgi:hypothetical protein
VALAVLGVIGALVVARDVYRMMRRPLQTSAEPQSGPPLTQADYDELLAADEVWLEQWWARVDDGYRCRRCRGVTERYLTWRHPIWDGPFEEAGAGRCDNRTVPYCERCRGPRAVWVEPGRPIRLPWLDGLPVRLLPRLYARPVFHELGVPIVRFEPPTPPDGCGCG